MSSAESAKPNEFRVRLGEVFSGPLDLLLHLVQENEVEISDVSLSRVCDQFLRFVRDIAEVDLGLAGDYLVVASTLVAIKSRALVANGEAVEIDDEIDPGDDLVRRLLEYRRVREASRGLSELASRRAALFSRGLSEMPPAQEGEIDLGEATAYDLLKAFAKLLRETGAGVSSHRVGTPDRSVASYVRDVAAVLRSTRSVRFRELFPDSIDRSSIIGVFLAILELGKQRAIRARQEGMYGEIAIERAVESIERFDQIVEGIAEVEEQGDDATAADLAADARPSTPPDPPASTTPDMGVMVRPPARLDGPPPDFSELHTDGC